MSQHKQQQTNKQIGFVHSNDDVAEKDNESVQKDAVIKKPVTFTPQYFFRSHHKFSVYLPRAKYFVGLLKNHEGVINKNFSWFVEDGVYNICVYGTFSEEGKAPVSYTIFKTRYQRDAMIAILFFQKVFGTSQSPRQSYKPSLNESFTILEVRQKLAQFFSLPNSESLKDKVGVFLSYMEYIDKLEGLTKNVIDDIDAHYKWIEQREKTLSIYEFSVFILNEAQKIREKLTN